jgi:hypothetical protein
MKVGVFIAICFYATQKFSIQFIHFIRATFNYSPKAIEILSL